MRKHLQSRHVCVCQVKIAHAASCMHQRMHAVYSGMKDERPLYKACRVMRQHACKDETKKYTSHMN
jgi:hypothetical protein